MANTGYIIHPNVIQVFTSGPSSGSIVSSSFTIGFSGSFTSSFLCNTEYVYKELNNTLCPAPGFCPSPSLISVDVFNCDVYDYVYNVVYDINNGQPSTTSSLVEYCLNNIFTGETGSYLVNNFNTINSASIDISATLIDLPLNSTVPVYFRIKNYCSGSLTSSYSNIISTNCETEIPPITITMKLLARSLTSINACDSSPTGYCVSDLDGDWCGNTYYVDNDDYTLCEHIYTNNAGTVLAPVGWYNNRYISRYWNGTTFTNIRTCI